MPAAEVSTTPKDQHNNTAARDIVISFRGRRVDFCSLNQAARAKRRTLRGVQKLFVRHILLRTFFHSELVIVRTVVRSTTMGQLESTPAPKVAENYRQLVADVAEANRM